MKIHPWFQTQWQRLIQSQRSDSMAHAYLFSGPRGIGKQELAEAFASHLLCQHHSDGPACGECPSCQLLKAGTHPDIMLISPEGASETIQVDQIRKLIEYLSLKPHQAKHKVAIIHAADRMNNNAANSLLKSLEEPPPASMLILSTCYGGRLLPTIKSRCQQINFSLPAEDIARPWLASRLDKPDQAELFLRLAHGAPVLALDFTNEEVLEHRNKVFSGLQSLQQNSSDVLQITAAWKKLDTSTTLTWMLSFVSDMARLKVAEYPPAINNPDLADPFRQMTQNISLALLLDYLGQVQRASRYVQGNMNRDLLFEELLFNWVDLPLKQHSGVAVA